MDIFNIQFSLKVPSHFQLFLFYKGLKIQNVGVFIFTCISQYASERLTILYIKLYVYILVSQRYWPISPFSGLVERIYLFIFTFLPKLSLIQWSEPKFWNKVLCRCFAQNFQHYIHPHIARSPHWSSQTDRSSRKLTNVVHMNIRYSTICMRNLGKKRHRNINNLFQTLKNTIAM
jgi:hypothetical protein